MPSFDSERDEAPQPIRVAHSILDATELAAACAQRYGLAGPIRAQLLVHGQNDWYALAAGDRRWALRVVKAGARTRAQLLAELDWQRRLGVDLAVPQPLKPASGRAPVFALAAPEGERWACVMPWIGGRTLDARLDANDAFEAGALLARVHAHPARLASGARRHDLGEKVARTAGSLEAALEDEPSRRLVAAARQATARALAAAATLPQGSLHGDLHFGNLRRDETGRLWLLDFDDCGDGALCADLTAFFWRNRCESLARQLDERFVAGYESVRALTPEERSALPGLALARALYLAGVLARDRDILGRVPGFDRPWAHYLGLIEQALTQM